MKHCIVDTNKEDDTLLNIMKRESDGDEKRRGSTEAEQEILTLLRDTLKISEL